MFIQPNHQGLEPISPGFSYYRVQDQMDRHQEYDLLYIWPSIAPTVLLATLFDELVQRLAASNSHYNVVLPSSTGAALQANRALPFTLYYIGNRGRRHADGMYHLRSFPLPPQYRTLQHLMSDPDFFKPVRVCTDSSTSPTTFYLCLSMCLPRLNVRHLWHSPAAPKLSPFRRLHAEKLQQFSLLRRIQAGLSPDTEQAAIAMDPRCHEDDDLATDEEDGDGYPSNHPLYVRPSGSSRRLAAAQSPPTTPVFPSPSPPPLEPFGAGPTFQSIPPSPPHSPILGPTSTMQFPFPTPLRRISSGRSTPA